LKEGKVYLATSKETGKQSVLKVYLYENTKDFLNEIMIHKTLINHANILRADKAISYE
jgi:serine/threonine protein kinase